MPTATVTSKGQVTVPKRVREYLHLEEGDQVDFVIEADGEVHLQPVRSSVRRLFGMLRRPGASPVSVEQMHEDLIERAVQEDRRAREQDG